MPLEAGLLTGFSLLMLALAARRLEWGERYPLYLVFLIVAGMANSLISHTLVIGGRLEFTWRPFPEWTLNNIVYDLWLMPVFTLLLVDAALKMGRKWEAVLFYPAFNTVLDYYVLQYTLLLSFKKWTLAHTAISSVLVFFIWFWFYHWLARYMRPVKGGTI